jgi:hypothetical protein
METLFGIWMKAFFKFGKQIVGKIFPLPIPQESAAQESLEPFKLPPLDQSRLQFSDMDKTTRISDHFTLGELCKSQTAERLGIENLPNEDQLECLKQVTENVLEPVRVFFDKPFAPNSGFRCLELNEAIGSSAKSQHCKGQAIDFEISTIANESLARWIKENLDYDQLILEFYDGVDPNSGWVHVSYVSEEENRKEALIYNKSGYSFFE